MPGRYNHPEFYQGRDKRPLTERELAQIKRLLNIPQTAPFPKCPAKNRKKLRELEAAGEGWHSDPKHAPCHICTCKNVAGMGTPHYGYGWCYLHERRPSEKMCKVMAEADLRAHQQRHPRVFRNAVNYLQHIKEDGEGLRNQYDFTKEMGVARDLVQSINDRLSNYEKDREGTLKILSKEVAELKDMISLSPTGLTAPEKATIQEVLLGILTKLTIPLTEKGKGGPVEMCDKTRYELQLGSAETLTRISERVQSLQSVEKITNESFRVWWADFVLHLKREFGTLTYTREDGTFPIIEGIGECARRTGEPRRGL